MSGDKDRGSGTVEFDEEAEDPARVGELAESVRATLQAMLDEDVAARGSVFL